MLLNFSTAKCKINRKIIKNGGMLRLWMQAVIDI
jgi:hypothetical protein